MCLEHARKFLTFISFTIILNNNRGIIFLKYISAGENFETLRRYRRITFFHFPGTVSEEANYPGRKTSGKNFMNFKGERTRFYLDLLKNFLLEEHFETFLKIAKQQVSNLYLFIYIKLLFFS